MIGTTAPADESVPPSTKNIGADEAATAYRGIITALASPNAKPVTRNRANGHVTFPDGYDVAAQNRINAARKKLYANCEDALPYLIEALDDDRYCMTINWAEGDAFYNWDVGDISREIIENRLEVYRDLIRFSGPSHWNRYRYRPISKEWWEARRKKSLAELQIEAIDWAIEVRKGEDPTRVHPERALEVANLLKLRDEIQSTKRPAKPGRLLPMVTSDR
jgi:hypothetical protein